MPASPSRLGSRRIARSRSRSRSNHERTLSRSRSPRFDRNISVRGQDDEKYRSRDRGGKPDRERAGEDDDSREFGRSAKRPRVDHSRDREAGRLSLPGKDRESGRPSQPHRHRHRHHHRDEHPHRRRGGHSPKRELAEPASSSHKELPFDARQLSRSDLAAFKPLFADYLDLQKQIDISALDETELRGRWKSFMGKWNRGELAEGWYDPEVFQRAASEYQDVGGDGGEQQLAPARQQLPRSLSPVNRESEPQHQDGQEKAEVDDDDDDTYGPPPPPLPGQDPHHHHHHHPLSHHNHPSSSSRQPGPSIPTLTDLTLRNEALASDRAAALTDHRLARRAHTREQKALLDEALPRAAAGTHERRLENKRALNDKLRGFRDKSPGNTGEVPEGELMGEGDGGGVEEYKRMVTREVERKKERVSRREEEERARRVEREERVREYREREERVVEGLRALARARFGGGEVGGGGGGGK